MKINVRLFSIYRDIVGVGEMTIEAAEKTTNIDILETLLHEYPRLRLYEKTLVIAVNREIVDLGMKLRDGDEVAIMPPVGGG